MARRRLAGDAAQPSGGRSGCARQAARARRYKPALSAVRGRARRPRSLGADAAPEMDLHLVSQVHHGVPRRLWRAVSDLRRVQIGVVVKNATTNSRAPKVGRAAAASARRRGPKMSSPMKRAVHAAWGGSVAPCVGRDRRDTRTPISAVPGEQPPCCPPTLMMCSQTTM